MFTEGKGDEIESRLSPQILSTLSKDIFVEIYGIYLVGILCRKWHVVCAHSSCSAKKDMATGNLHIYWETHILIGHKSNIKVYGFHK